MNIPNPNEPEETKSEAQNPKKFKWVKLKIWSVFGIKRFKYNISYRQIQYWLGIPRHVQFNFWDCFLLIFKVSFMLVQACSLNRNILVQSRTIEPAERKREWVCRGNSWITPTRLKFPYIKSISLNPPLVNRDRGGFAYLSFYAGSCLQPEPKRFGSIEDDWASRNTPQPDPLSQWAVELSLPWWEGLREVDIFLCSFVSLWLMRVYHAKTYFTKHLITLSRANLSSPYFILLPNGKERDLWFAAVLSYGIQY